MRSIDADALIELIDRHIRYADDVRIMYSRSFVDGMTDGYLRIRSDVTLAPTIEPKRDEVVVNEACLNCELDCVEVVRCHDCRNYEEAKNSCNGMCKEWNTSTYTWDYCSRGERKDEVEE